MWLVTKSAFMFFYCSQWRSSGLFLLISDDGSSTPGGHKPGGGCNKKRETASVE
jgi:hypothetical protein